MKKNIYVIIVTYNGAQWIERCLDSVYKSTINAIPIIIDNGSTDNTLSFIKRHYPQCHIIESKENLGFGKANNLGIKYAIAHEAEYVYLLNQDAWVEPDVFEILIHTHKNNPTYGILSPIQLTGNGTTLDKSFKENSVSKERCRNFLNDWDNKTMKDLYQTIFVMAAHWLLYIPYLQKVGTFSPAFPHYGEDSNLCHRFRWHGYKIGICGNAIAYHDRQYRILSSSKKLYLCYITFITKVNNPHNCFYHHRIKALLRLIGECLFKFNDVSIIERFNFIKQGLKGLRESSYYTNKYKTINSNIY